MMEGRWEKIIGYYREEYWYNVTRYEHSGAIYHYESKAELWKSKAGKTERWRYRTYPGKNPFGTLLPVGMTLEEAKQFIEVLVRME